MWILINDRILKMTPECDCFWILAMVRSGSRTDATSKVELFIIIVNGWIRPRSASDAECELVPLVSSLGQIILCILQA